MEGQWDGRICELCDNGMAGELCEDLGPGPGRDGVVLIKDITVDK